MSFYEFGIVVVWRVWKVFQAAGRTMRNVDDGGTRKTMLIDDLYVIRQSKRDSNNQYTTLFSNATAWHVSWFLVSRYLFKGGLSPDVLNDVSNWQLLIGKLRLDWYEDWIYIINGARSLFQVRAVWVSQAIPLSEVWGSIMMNRTWAPPFKRMNCYWRFVSKLNVSRASVTRYH